MILVVDFDSSYEAVVIMKKIKFLVQLNYCDVLVYSEQFARPIFDCGAIC